MAIKLKHDNFLYSNSPFLLIFLLIPPFSRRLSSPFQKGKVSAAVIVAVERRRRHTRTLIVVDTQQTFPVDVIEATLIVAVPYGCGSSPSRRLNFIIKIW